MAKISDCHGRKPELNVLADPPCYSSKSGPLSIIIKVEGNCVFLLGENLSYGRFSQNVGQIFGLNL